MHAFLVRPRACAIAALLIASAPAMARSGRSVPGAGSHAWIGTPASAAGRMAAHGRRGLPPISGVIHERPGARTVLTMFGRTGTGSRPRIYAGGRLVHATGGFGARRFAGRDLVQGFGGGFEADDGTGDYDAAGTYGAPGIYGGEGTYGSVGTYGAPGTYGSEGTYGSTATQSLYGNGGGVPYRSERPLAARYVEPPLGPSPRAPYDPADRYADDRAGRIGAARIIRVGVPGSGRPCTCGPRVLPYGVGTAY